MTQQALVPDDLVNAQMDRAFAAVADHTPARDDILGACEEAAYQLESWMRSACRMGGAAPEYTAWLITCLRAPGEKVRAQT